MVEKKSNTTTQYLVVFISVMVAIVLLSALAGVVLSNTQLTSVDSETYAILNPSAVSVNTTPVYTVTNAPTGWRTQDSECYLSSFSITNKTGTVLTLDTDYNVSLSTGTYQLKNTTASKALVPVDNNTYVNYKYCGSDYQSLSWSRSVLNLVIGLLVLGILIFVVLWATKQFEDKE